MKRLNTVPAAILAVLLIACLVAVYTTRSAGTPTAIPRFVNAIVCMIAATA